MEELVAAINALIDARLTEHGLLQTDDPAPTKAKGKGKTKGGDAVDLDSLKAKVTELVNKKGKDAAKALLKKAKIDKLSELPEKHYAKFNELLDAELSEDDDGGDDLFGE